MRHLFGSAVFLGSVFIARSGAAEEVTPETASTEQSGFAFTPTLGPVFPIGGTSRLSEQMAVGGHVGATVGWQFSAVPFRLSGGIDYSRHFTTNHTTFTREGGTEVLDTAIDGRYWPVSWFFVDAAFGWSTTSVVRIRQLATVRTTGSTTSTVSSQTVLRADIPSDSGFVTGGGFGFALLRLTAGPREPSAPMLLVGVDSRIRLLSTGTVVTVPFSVSLNL